MHTADSRRIRFTRYIAMPLILAGLCWSSAAYPQNGEGDAVEELRQILKCSVNDPAVRDRKAQEQIRALHGISELRRALALREWRDLEFDGKVGDVDQRNRATLVAQLELAVRDVFRQGDETSRLAALSILTEMGCSARGVGIRSGLAAGFAPDLVDLIKHGAPNVRETAGRTLGLINPDPQMALPTLGVLLRSSELTERIVAADALGNLVRCATLLATAPHTQEDVTATREEVVQMGQALVPLAGLGLRDARPEVRRRCAAAIGYAAEALQKLVKGPGPLDPMAGLDVPPADTAAERSELMPLILALKDQSPALTRALADSDAQVRLLARHALEDMTNPQLRLLERAGGTTDENGKHAQAALQPSRFVQGSASPKDSLIEGLHATVMALAGGLQEPDARARRAAIDVLETVGPAAAPAASALVAALADSDLFVRWAAARTLGKIGPVEADAAVPALGRLLEDPDLDLRLSAATALERYGVAAKAAVPDLARSIGSSDAELRLAAIRVLGVIGSPHSIQAIPALSAALADPNPRVRAKAAETLGKLGPAARSSVDPLRQALRDTNTEVQKAASEALLRIMRPAKK